ncbi:MAG: LysE family transporter [Spirochaetales bacterium]|uniref:LysE family transporter n=1 Tax=Candidatus Thalassospirochaeta sargassi TaxID=3119039 RepID=A0AAJ1MK64_9SPIO|nr:LysE family transporter [Spirochaetales bacterium]
MENHWLIFLTSFTIAFSGAMMPGPLLSATISESVRRGASAGPLFMLGHGILEIGLIAALFLGLAPFLTNPAVFKVIAVAGGGFMIFMAAGMFRSLKGLSIDTTAGTPVNGNIVLLGAGMSMANPYWIIWWATIGLGYILSAGELGFSGIAIFFFGHILADTIWYTFVSFGVAKSRKIMSDRVYRVLIGICACFLAGYAVYLLLNTFLI